MRIVVRYPAGENRLVLRTSVDWESDVAPVESNAEGAEFDVAIDTPFLALKPCLYVGEQLHWSVGENYVLSAHDPDPAIWPAFFVSPRGDVSDLLRFEHLGRTYCARVYTPPGYRENTLRRYPVLYMQDGSNLFFPEEAFGGNEWHVDETLDRFEQMNSLRKVIVIGIAPHDRMQDYTAPGYEDYGSFLTSTVKPAIDAQYRTRTSASETVVSGSSLGGVVSLYLAWRHPEVFGGAMCLSSTFGFQDDLFARIARDDKPAIRVYLDSGWPRDNFDATNAMRDLLVNRGFKLGDDLLAFSFPDGQHDEQSWAERIHIPFQFFFGRSWIASRR